MNIFAQKPKVLPAEVLAVGTGPGCVIYQAVKSLLADGTQIMERQLPGKKCFFFKAKLQVGVFAWTDHPRWEELCDPGVIKSWEMFEKIG